MSGSDLGGGDMSSPSEGELTEFLRLLKMKHQAVFQHVQVIALSPFQVPGVPEGEAGGSQFQRWQVLTRPVATKELLAAIVRAITGEQAKPPPQTRLPPSMRLSRHPSSFARLRYSPLGMLARHPHLRELPIRVLVVDDMPVKQNLIRWICESHGMHCDRAMDGFECLQVPRPPSPALSCSPFLR